MEAFTNGWTHVVPNNEKHFLDAASRINNYIAYSPNKSEHFKVAYNNWNKEWIDHVN